MSRYQTPGDLPTLRDQFLDHKALRGAARNTVEAYRTDLNLMIAFMASRGVTLVQLVSERLLNRWIDDGMIHFHWSRRTAARRVSAARSFLDWCRAEGYTGDHNAAAHVHVKFRQKTVVAPELDGLKGVIARIGARDPIDLRDRAILLLMLDAALRAGEVVALNAPGQGEQTFTVDLQGERVFARPKGMADDDAYNEVVGIEPQTVAAVKAWLRMRDALAPKEEPALFVNTRGARLARQSLYVMVRARGAAAGMPHLHPHLFRHRRVAEVVESLGVKYGQAIARHRQASTTINVYGAHAAEVVRRAVRTSVPIGEVSACNA